MSGDAEIVAGSGNVFADLGLENADELMARAQLGLLLRQHIETRQLTQAAVTELLGADHTSVSTLMSGRLAELTSDRLIRYLNRLGCNVIIRVQSPAENCTERRMLVTDLTGHHLQTAPSPVAGHT